MEYMIKNDLKVMSPDFSAATAVDFLGGFLFLGSAAGMAFGAVMAFMTSPFYALALLSFVPFLIFLALWAGNADVRLRIDNKETPKSKLYKRYKNLPEPVKKQVGKLTVDALWEMENSDVNKLHNAIASLESAYWTNQKALTTPHVSTMLTNIYEAKRSYDTHTKMLTTDPLDELER